MRLACVMVGNSSSGLIEAPSFRLPVVNIGSRQDGRVRAANVIDVRCDARAITDGISRAMAPTFRESLINSANPYDAGRPASEIVVQALKRFVLRNDLYNKHFYDLLAKPFDRNGTST
jgi:UDP-N-acetylglucosamine 2-epimerase